MALVYRNKDGLYLQYMEATTHTGTHRRVEWVADLHQATVFWSLPPYQVRRDHLADAERLEVRTERRVFLVSDAQTENTPDLWVSEQHGSLVTIPGYLEPDTSVYTNWRKANYQLEE